MLAAGTQSPAAPTSFVDAVSISGWAYANRVPVMLQTWGGSAAERGFGAEAASVIAGRDLIVCGGEMAVSDGSVSGLGGEVAQAPEFCRQVEDALS